MPGDSDYDKFQVEGDLTTHVTDLWTSKQGRMRLNGEWYRFAYLGEVDAEPQQVYIRRERDGRMFECELWVNIYAGDPPDIRKQETVEVAEVPGQGKLL